MEADNLYKLLYKTTRTYPLPADVAPLQGFNCGLNEERQAWWSTTLNLQNSTGQVKLKMLKCPSDTVDESTTLGCVVATHINVNNGAFEAFLGNLAAPGSDVLGRTSYTGVAGTAGDFDSNNTQFSYAINGGSPDFRQWVGIMYNRSTLTLGQITVQDGTSNTLLFGESLGGVGVGPRDTAWTWFGVGSMGTFYGLGNSRVGLLPDPTAQGQQQTSPGFAGYIPPPNGDGPSWYRFSSRHAAVVQFCFGDVSTRGVRFGATPAPNGTPGGPLNTPGNNTSDWALLQQLAGRIDGFSNDTSNIVD
jgi:hypothetical protein